MPLSIQGHALAVCFHYYLQGLQAACSFNTDVLAMDLLTFANQKIADILPTTPYQNQFLQAVSANTGLHISSSDLTGNTLFLDLLNQYRPLQFYFGNYLMSMAADPYPSNTIQAFSLALASAAFPGGATGEQWTAVIGGLTSASPNVVPPECFTSKLQTQLASSITSAGTKMDAIIASIAGLG
jgi:hypothetical protein